MALKVSYKRFWITYYKMRMRKTQQWWKRWNICRTVRKLQLYETPKNDDDKL
jgi:hypothetical protein